MGRATPKSTHMDNVYLMHMPMMPVHRTNQHNRVRNIQRPPNLEIVRRRRV